MKVQGNWMPCDLSDPSPLIAAVHTPGRPSDALLRLSYEMSVTAYDFDTQRWYAAGWRDFSFRINRQLYTGTDVNKENAGIQDSIKSGYYQILARQKIRFASPLAQYRGIGDGSDHAKAVFMLIPCGGVYIVGIGFTGTCRRFDDWLPNLLMDEKDGLHAGFLRLSREIWNDAPRISFPACAAQLGLDSLTLADIIGECRSEASRFLIWMSGHSQGGAVMQVFARYLCRKGVLPGNLIGCAFASPSVLWQPEPVLKHLHLVMNSDDLIPRFGARCHYGLLWMADMNDITRRLCYSTDADSPCMQVILDLSHRIRTSEDALLVSCCLLEILRDQDLIRAPQVLSALLSYLKTDPLQKLEERLDHLTDRVRMRALRYYREFSGRDSLDEEKAERTKALIRDAMLTYGESEFTRCLKNVLSYPHRIRNNESAHRLSPYNLICRTDAFPLRQVSDLDLEVRPVGRYTASAPALGNAAPKRAHLKQRRFLFNRSGTFGRRK